MPILYIPTYNVHIVPIYLGKIQIEYILRRSIFISGYKRRGIFHTIPIFFQF